VVDVVTDRSNPNEGSEDDGVDVGVVLTATARQADAQIPVSAVPLAQHPPRRATPLPLPDRPHPPQVADLVKLLPPGDRSPLFIHDSMVAI